MFHLYLRVPTSSKSRLQIPYTLHGSILPDRPVNFFLMNELRIYRSSAGSGKTYMLVLEYLKLVLSNPKEFRHILAVTFTNKAAEEMKSRVISSLKELSEGKNQLLHQQLRKVLSGSIDIKANAGLCLTLILHNYSDFSVTTI